MGNIVIHHFFIAQTQSSLALIFLPRFHMWHLSSYSHSLLHLYRFRDSKLEKRYQADWVLNFFPVHCRGERSCCNFSGDLHLFSAYFKILETRFPAYFRLFWCLFPHCCPNLSKNSPGFVITPIFFGIFCHPDEKFGNRNVLGSF